MRIKDVMNWLTEPVVICEEKQGPLVLGELRPGQSIDWALYESNRQAIFSYIEAQSKPVVEYDGSNPADLVLLKGN